ncbi:MAG TPA: protein kinase [Trebonia sp.]|nr:protein kinase [Trebonia sp.]
MNAYVLDGRYALVELIATGGMGEVWRGTDQILGRPVAIKMLAAMHADDEQFRARFRAEARYASSLSHPGITRVFDYGERSPLGGPYLVMELVDGQPLSEILERYGRLDANVVLDIVAQSARALDTAHQAGIVHRDIKPGNLLIMADGTTKITDFGIAKANSLQAMNLTATGIVMGTALYVSPEQATGSPLTGSSDIYSLGVVAYECLSGQPPFMADQPLAIAIMHKHDPVPPLPPDVPRPVADLVYAMLAKAPDGRPETAQHVADRAEVIREARGRSGTSGPITSDLPVVPNFPPPDGNDFYNNGNDFYNGEPAWSPAPSPRRRALVLAGAGLAACGILAVIIILLTSSTTPAATLPKKPGHSASSSQSASEAASPTTASLPATTVGGYATRTNLSTASKSPAATRSPSPTTSARQSPTPTHSSPSTSTSPSAPATVSSSSPTGPATSSAPVTSPPATLPTSASPTAPATGAAGTPAVGSIGG